MFKSLDGGSNPLQNKVLKDPGLKARVSPNWSNSLQVLLIGRDDHLLWFLPALLSRAGFIIDVLSSSPLMKSCHFVRDCEIVSKASLINRAAQKCQNGYEWVIIGDDGMLLEIVQSDLSDEIKLKLLPVLKEENFSHVHSKIGLSNLFSTQGIKTPAYRIATNIDEALVAAEQIGYPVLLKIDASGGGFGVHECQSLADLKAVNEEVWLKPLLVQKKIKGIDLDLSALYLEGELIHFSYSKMEKVISNQFGPSSLRSYRSLSCVDEEVFNELQAIGKALGAHGFTNITCIEAFDGCGRYYVEADMRANMWLDAPLFFGEDVANRIACWYLEGKKLQYPVIASQEHPSVMLIPCFLRLKFFELLMNRYHVWKFIPKNNARLIRNLLFEKMKKSISCYNLKNIVKRFAPKKYHKFLKKVYMSICSKFEINSKL
mgnify:CR=1 FL=1